MRGPGGGLYNEKASDLSACSFEVETGISGFKGTSLAVQPGRMCSAGKQSISLLISVRIRFTSSVCVTADRNENDANSIPFEASLESNARKISRK